MRLNTEDIQLLNAFESITGARTVDCLRAEDTVIFIVREGQLGRAIGKGGENINRARRKIGKRIAVFEDCENPRDFINKACKPLRASPDIGEDCVRIDVPRGQREQASGRRLRILKELFKRKLDVSKVDFSFV